MQIILLRHGKVNGPPISILSAENFSEWVYAYDNNELDSSSKPTEDARHIVTNANAVVCSDLPRSIESAKILGVEDINLCHSLFNEAGLPVAKWKYPKLSVRIWVIIFRIIWLFGYSKNSESFTETKVRASKASAKLIEIAEEHQSVVFIGHGIFNHFVAKELKKQGWIGPRSSSKKHWNYSIYKL